MAVAKQSRGKPTGRVLMERASAVAVLMTNGDTMADWLVAGQARARVLLTACTAGLVASCVNEPVAVPLIRRLVSGLVREASDPGVPGRRGGMPPDAIPQTVICLSHPADLCADSVLAAPHFPTRCT